MAYRFAFKCVAPRCAAAQILALRVSALSQKRLDKHPLPDACRVAFRCFAIPCIARQGGSQTHAPSVTDAWVSVAELHRLQPSCRYVCALLGSTAQLHNSPAPLFHCLALSGLSLLCVLRWVYCKPFCTHLHNYLKINFYLAVFLAHHHHAKPSTLHAP